MSDVFRPQCAGAYRRRAAAAAAIAVLLACVGACQFAPPHERPAAPVNPQYSADYGGPSPGARAARVGWREFFADERLEALIDLALKRNRDLASAVAQIEQARGQYRIQRSEQLPNIDLNAEERRLRVNAASLGVGGGPGVAGRVETTAFNTYSLNAAVSVFELDFWGRVRNLTAAARLQYLSTVEAARAFRLSLIRDVASAYLASLEAEERMKLAEATVRSRREGLRIAKRRLDAGITSELDYRQAETLLTQAETELAALNLTKAQSDNLLTRLIGGPVDEPLPPPAPLAEQTQVETLVAGLPSELLITRPDIIGAEHRLRAARANIGAARAAFLPSITLTGAYGYASTDLSDLINDSGRTWSYGPTITLPIFDFGRRGAQLAVAEAQQNTAIADYQRTIQTAFQEVSNALAGRRYLAEQVAAQERATVAQRRLAELARTRYREGVVNYLEVLDAERNLFGAEQALLQVRRAEAANLVSLYVALGGGALE